MNPLAADAVASVPLGARRLLALGGKLPKLCRKPREAHIERRFKIATHVASWTAKRCSVAVWSGQSYKEEEP
jgi:hypothetical protein